MDKPTPKTEVTKPRIPHGGSNIPLSDQVILLQKQLAAEQQKSRDLALQNQILNAALDATTRNIPKHKEFWMKQAEERIRSGYKA